MRSASDGASLLRIDRLVKFQAETSVNAPFWQSGSVLEIFFLHCYAGLLFHWLVFGFFFHMEAKLCVLLLETKPTWFMSRNLGPEPHEFVHDLTHPLNGAF